MNVTMRLALRRAAFFLASLLIAHAAPAQQKLSHGLFDDVAIYRPQGAATGAVLLLSGDAPSPAAGKSGDVSSAMASSRHNQDAEERALRVLRLKVLHVTGLKDVICVLFLRLKTSFSTSSAPSSHPTFRYKWFNLC